MNPGWWSYLVTSRLPLSCINVYVLRNSILRQVIFPSYKDAFSIYYKLTHTHTHRHTQIPTYICLCACVFLYTDIPSITRIPGMYVYSNARVYEHRYRGANIFTKGSVHFNMYTYFLVFIYTHVVHINTNITLLHTLHIYWNSIFFSFFFF